MLKIVNNQKPICSNDHFLWVSIKSPLNIVTIMNPPPIMSIHGMNFMLHKKVYYETITGSKTGGGLYSNYYCLEEENE